MNFVYRLFLPIVLILSCSLSRSANNNSCESSFENFTVTSVNGLYPVMSTYADSVHSKLKNCVLGWAQHVQMNSKNYLVLPSVLVAGGDNISAGEILVRDSSNSVKRIPIASFNFPSTRGSKVGIQLFAYSEIGPDLVVDDSGALKESTQSGFSLTTNSATDTVNDGTNFAPIGPADFNLRSPLPSGSFPIALQPEPLSLTSQNETIQKITFDKNDTDLEKFIPVQMGLNLAGWPIYHSDDLTTPLCYVMPHASTSHGSFCYTPKAIFSTIKENAKHTPVEWQFFRSTPAVLHKVGGTAESGRGGIVAEPEELTLIGGTAESGSGGIVAEPEELILIGGTAESGSGGIVAEPEELILTGGTAESGSGGIVSEPELILIGGTAESGSGGYHSDPTCGVKLVGHNNGNYYAQPRLIQASFNVTHRGRTGVMAERPNDCTGVKPGVTFVSAEGVRSERVVGFRTAGTFEPYQYANSRNATFNHTQNKSMPGTYERVALNNFDYVDAFDRKVRQPLENKEDRIFSVSKGSVAVNGEDQTAVIVTASLGDETATAYFTSTGQVLEKTDKGVEVRHSEFRDYVTVAAIDGNGQVNGRIAMDVKGMFFEESDPISRLLGIQDQEAMITARKVGDADSESVYEGVADPEKNIVSHSVNQCFTSYTL